MSNSSLFQKIVTSRAALIASVIGCYVLAIMIGILGGLKIGESVGDTTAFEQHQRMISLQQEMISELEHQTQLLLQLEDNPVILGESEEQHD